MSELIKFPGAGVAVRPTKKAGTALIGATLDRVAAPLQVARRCSNELRGVLRNVGDTNPHRGCLPNAKFNHDRMLSRAAMVRRTHTALWAVAFPNMIATPRITREDAIMMLTVLFGAVGKAKGGDNAVLLSACVDMFAPGVDAIGEATGLWRPVSSHPVILALAVRKLINNAVFTSAAELRTALQEARNSILWLTQDADRWLTLLQNSDRVVFEYDRVAWDLAYAKVGADVVRLMQDPDEEPYADDDVDEPASPRWAAQEALRLAKLSE